MTDLQDKARLTAEIQEKIALLNRLKAELAYIQTPKKDKVKKVGAEFHIPQNSSGKNLRPLSELSQEEKNVLRIKYLLKKAAEYRDQAAWNLLQASKLEDEAKSLEN